MNLMVESTNSMIKSWENRVEGKGGLAEIEVDQDLRSLSADIISRACFGSSYSKGEEIFFQIRTLQKVLPKGKRFVGVPGLRYEFYIMHQGFVDAAFLLFLYTTAGSCRPRTIGRNGDWRER